VSKGLVSDILNYKKGLSKEIIRKLSDTFKLSQETFNRHYDLVASVNGKRIHSGKVSLGRELQISLAAILRFNVTYLTRELKLITYYI